MSTQLPGAPPSVGSAAFWKKRLQRALLLVALALVAVQLLPQLPTEQRLEVRAPAGYAFRSLGITYFEPAGSDALSGTQFRLPAPSARAFHQTRLPNGTYRVVIAATLQRAGAPQDDGTAPPTEPTTTLPPPDQGHQVETERTLPLSGELVQVFLAE